MKIIVITLPHFWQGEAQAINELFEAGLEILHLRKPQATVNELVNLLQDINPLYYSRIVTHEHFELLQQFPLKGIHLNGRNPDIPAGHTAHVSASCHSLEEVAAKKAFCHYVFLSPIFDSISKAGYASAFDTATLQQASASGLIDAQVMALGGINATRLALVKAIGFGGAAILGDLWEQPSEQRTTHLIQLQQEAL